MIFSIFLSLATLLFVMREAGGGGAEASSADTLAGILGSGEVIGNTPAQANAGANEGGSGNVAVAEEEGAAEGEVAEAEPVEGEAEGEVEAGAEGEVGEEELAPGEGETDYSDEVYARYAQHYSKQWNQQINPDDPVHRAMLREIIQRGENFRRLEEQRQSAEESVEDEPAEEEAAETEQAGPETPEQVQQFLTNVDKFAESRIRPEVASKFATDFMTALWGEKGAEMAKKLPPTSAHNFTKVMTSFGYLFLNDALPHILENYIPGLMSRQYPGFDQVQQDAVNEAAFNALAGKTDRNGNALFPDLEELVFGDNSPLEEVYRANPWLSKHRFVDERGRMLPPIEQEARRLEIAIGMSRGIAPPIELMRGSAEAARQQERRAARVTGAGRLAPGESGGTFERRGDDADQLMKDMNQFGDRDRQIQDMLAPKR